MKRSIIILRVLTAFCILSAVALWFFFSPTRDEDRALEVSREAHVPKETAMLSVNNTSITVEIVRTPEEFYKGLSGRTSLEPDFGMWFDFSTDGRQGIWMKDMKFPIDILWIDSNQIIITIEENVAPDTYPKVFYPTRDARFVLEVSAGTVEKYSFEVGQEVFMK